MHHQYIQNLSPCCFCFCLLNVVIRIILKDLTIVHPTEKMICFRIRTTVIYYYAKFLHMPVNKFCLICPRQLMDFLIFGFVGLRISTFLLLLIILIAVFLAACFSAVSLSNLSFRKDHLEPDIAVEILSPFDELNFCCCNYLSLGNIMIFLSVVFL